MSVAFEIAKRLYGLYLRGATGYGTAAADASLGAAALFVVWLYYSALVFLLGRRRGGDLGAPCHAAGAAGYRRSSRSR
jgi:hypothetical protein